MKAANLGRMTAIGALITLLGTGAWAARHQAPPAGSGSGGSKGAPAAITRATPTPLPATFTYQGSDGQSALALLQAKAEVSVMGTGSSTVVTSINGHSADVLRKQYWAYSVNDEPIDTPAARYITKSSDIIKWQMLSY